MEFTMTAKGAPALILKYLVNQKNVAKSIGDVLITEGVEDQ